MYTVSVPLRNLESNNDDTDNDADNKEKAFIVAQRIFQRSACSLDFRVSG